MVALFGEFDHWSTRSERRSLDSAQRAFGKVGAAESGRLGLGGWTDATADQVYRHGASGYGQRRKAPIKKREFSILDVWQYNILT